MTGAINKAGTAYPSQTPEFKPCFQCGSSCSIVSFLSDL